METTNTHSRGIVHFKLFLPSPDLSLNILSETSLTLNVPNVLSYLRARCPFRYCDGEGKEIVGKDQDVLFSSTKIRIGGEHSTDTS